MARVDRRRAQREARHARSATTRRRTGGGGRRTASARSVENQLFFTRLRTQAKWAFALMVIVFVVGFAFLGVGSGGLDLQSLVQDVFGSKGGSSGPSVSKALKDVSAHPREAKVYKELADAYARAHNDSAQIGALQQYLRLAPNDVTQLQRLGQLQITTAQTASQELQTASLRQQNDRGGDTFGVGGKFGNALGQNQLTQAVSAQDSAAVTQASSAYQASSSQAIATFKRLAKVQHTQTNLVLLANVATQLNDIPTAVKALKSVLRLKGIDPATRAAVKSKLRQLQPSVQKP